MQCISTSGSRPATCGSGNVFPITASTRTPSTTPTCWCGRRLYAPSGASPTSKPISAPVTAMPYCTGTAPRGAMSIPARVSFCGCATKALRFRKKSSEPASGWCWTFWRSYAATSRTRSAASSCCAITSPLVRAVIACWRSMPGRHPRGPPAR